MKALVLIGSPRLFHSNSAAIGNYLAERMKEHRVEILTDRIYSALKSEDKTQKLLEKIELSELIVLAVPLYVDSSPAGVIRFMERFSRKDRKSEYSKKRFAVLINCGFPEAEHNEVALRIYRCFAQGLGFTWAGGLSIGMGEMVGRKPLDKAGGAVRKLKQALELSGRALAKGKSIPLQAEKLLAKPSVPRWLYRWMGNWGWKRVFKKRGTQHRVKDQPDQPGSGA